MASAAMLFFVWQWRLISEAGKIIVFSLPAWSGPLPILGGLPYNSY